MFPSISTLLGYGWDMFDFYGPLFSLMLGVFIFPVLVRYGFRVLRPRRQSEIRPGAPATGSIGLSAHGRFSTRVVGQAVRAEEYRSRRDSD